MNRSLNWVFGICVPAVCLGVIVAFAIAVRPDPASAAAARAYCDRISPIEVQEVYEVHEYYDIGGGYFVAWDVQGRTADGRPVMIRVEPTPPLDLTRASRIWVRPRAGRFALADAR